MIPIEEKPTLEQAMWVCKCLFEGWVNDASMRGMVEKYMGFDIPGESLAFQDVGLQTLWNALPEAPGHWRTEPLPPYVPMKPSCIFTIRYKESGGALSHKILGNEDETEEEIAAQWVLWHPRAEIIQVTREEKK